MPSDPTDPDNQAQPPPGEHRLVWRGDTPVMAEADAEGVVHLHPVHTVPDGCWSQPFCALPDWASSMNDPAQQMAVLVTVLASRQLEAIDALKATILHADATRILLREGVSQAMINERLAKLYDMIKAVSGTLDP
jgi:hypothetical protein